MENQVSIIKMGCEALGGGCFWTEFWASFEPMANFLAHDGFRNFILVIAAVVTLIIALKRLVIADEDKKTSIKQAETSEASLNIDRFQRGLEMLDRQHFTTKQSGIFILSELVRKYPDEFLDQVLKTFYSKLKQVSKEQCDKAGVENVIDYNFHLPIDPVCQAIVVELSNLKQYFYKNAHQPHIKSDLTGINLSRLILSDGDLSSASFEFSNLSDITILKTNLSNAKFSGSIMNRANLRNSNLKRSVFSRTFSDIEPIQYRSKDEERAARLYPSMEDRILYINQMDISGCDLDGITGLKFSDLQKDDVDYDNSDFIKELSINEEKEASKKNNNEG